MKAADEWPAFEERISYHFVTGPKGMSAAKQGAVAMVILRGELLEAAYVYYASGRKFTASESVAEARRQLKDYFANEDPLCAGEEPVALHPADLERKLTRVFDPWTSEEATCHALLKARGLSVNDIARLLQRLPGAGLTPPEPMVEMPEVPEEAAVHLLGAEITCDACSHYARLTYGMMARAARLLEVSVLSLDRQALAQVVQQFRCRKCGMKVGSVKEL